MEIPDVRPPVEVPKAIDGKLVESKVAESKVVIKVVGSKAAQDEFTLPESVRYVLIGAFLLGAVIVGVQGRTNWPIYKLVFGSDSTSKVNAK